MSTSSLLERQAMSEREEFEDFVRAVRPECVALSFRRDERDSGAYFYPGVEVLWQKWAARSTPKQGEAPKVCGVCFEEEAFTGTCGGGRANPRALCFQGAPPPSVEPAPAVCCQDFEKCSERCVPRANYWQAKAQLYPTPPQQVEPGWQPIETAPKDSKARLVWCPVRKNCYLVSWDGRYEGEWIHFCSGGASLSEDPSHWMPLPAAPQEPKP